MAEDLQSVKNDVAFLRSLASEEGNSLSRQGATLLTVGAIFSCVDVFYWADSARYLRISGLLEHVPWIAGSLLFLICLIFINAKIPRSTGAAARAISAASAGVGFGISAAVPALVVGAMALRQPLLVTSIFPVVLLTLNGAVWMVAYAVKRHAWFVTTAIGCLVATIVCGFVMGRPEEWLVLAAAMILLVAAPGAVLLYQRKD